MPGRPSAAAERAAKWLAAGKGPPAEAAKKFGLSSAQTRRIAAKVGLPPLPAGRPKAAPQGEVNPPPAPVPGADQHTPGTTPPTP